MVKRNKFHGRVLDGVDRPCDWPDCDSAGTFRAPLPRDGCPIGTGKENAAEAMPPLEGALGDRADGTLWLCLQHVREYNAGWDYFDGMNSGEINDFRDQDASWHRPTWPVSEPGAAFGMAEPPEAQGAQGAQGAQRASGPWTGSGAGADPQDIFASAPGRGARKKSAERKPAAAGFSRPFNMADLAALRLLGLDEDASTADIKASFKRLAKQHHPDLHQGDAEAGNRLRAVIEAYNRLSGAFTGC